MAVNKVVMNTENGEETLIDLTSDTVTPATLAEGTTAHDASGNVIAGTMSTDVVRYGAQNLTEAQKAQARQNIGALSEIDVPVKGTDYWTEADKEEIVQQVITALGTPVFGRVDADNNIILTGELADGTYTLKYEDAEGNVTEIGTLNTEPESSYTNWIPKATDLDGVTIYNGTGYKTGVRYSGSSQAEVSGDGMTLSGFIPVKAGDIVRMKNITIKPTSSVGNAHHICYFPSLSLSGGIAKDVVNTDFWTIVTDDTGNAIQFTIPSTPSMQYIRIQAEYIGADSILTINEPIE